MGLQVRSDSCGTGWPRTKAKRRRISQGGSRSDFYEFWTILDYFGPTLANVGLFLVHFGPFWTVFGPFWSISVHFGLTVT